MAATRLGWTAALTAAMMAVSLAGCDRPSQYANANTVEPPAVTDQDQARFDPEDPDAGEPDVEDDVWPPGPGPDPDQATARFDPEEPDGGEPDVDDEDVWPPGPGPGSDDMARFDPEEPDGGEPDVDDEDVWPPGPGPGPDPK